MITEVFPTNFVNTLIITLCKSNHSSQFVDEEKKKARSAKKTLKDYSLTKQSFERKQEEEEEKKE